MGGKGNIPREYRINQRIRVPRVHVIGHDGQQLGVMPIEEALRLARERELDLVEVAPTADPPVCRILDYGRLKYLQGKKERETRRGRKAAVVREVRVRPRIGTHDVEAKVRKVRQLLNDGAKVKVSVMFRGREITHPELGAQLLRRIAEDVQEEGKLESPPVQGPRSLSVVLAPVGKKGKVTQEVSDAQDKNA